MVCAGERRAPVLLDLLGAGDEIDRRAGAFGGAHAAFPTLPRRLEEQHRARHGDVQRLAGIHRDRDDLVEWQVAIESVHLVAEDERGRHSEVDRLGRVAARCGRADPAEAERTERLEHLHCGHALHGPDRETHAGRGAYDLGIVRVDRTGPEAEHGCARGRGAAHERARVARIRDRRAHDDKRRVAERVQADVRLRDHGKHRLRCARVADAIGRTRREIHDPHPGTRRVGGDGGRAGGVHRLDRRTRRERGRDDPRTFDHEHTLLLARGTLAEQHPQPRDLGARCDRRRARRRRGPRARSRPAHRTSPVRAPRCRRGSCGRRRSMPP